MKKMSFEKVVDIIGKVSWTTLQFVGAADMAVGQIIGNKKMTLSGMALTALATLAKETYVMKEHEELIETIERN